MIEQQPRGGSIEAIVAIITALLPANDPTVIDNPEKKEVRGQLWRPVPSMQLNNNHYK